MYIYILPYFLCLITITITITMSIRKQTHFTHYIQQKTHVDLYSQKNIAFNKLHIFNIQIVPRSFHYKF